jgi:hypothetical protein
MPRPGISALVKIEIIGALKRGKAGRTVRLLGQPAHTFLDKWPDNLSNLEV